MDLREVFALDRIPHGAPDVHVACPMPMAGLHIVIGDTAWCYRRNASNTAWVIKDVRSAQDHAYIDPWCGC